MRKACRRQLDDLARKDFAYRFDEKYFVEFLIDGLMRGDLKSRYDFYAIGRSNGWLSANDIRRLENMNPLPPEQGDVYLIPLNMVQAGTSGKTSGAVIESSGSSASSGQRSE